MRLVVAWKVFPVLEVGVWPGEEGKFIDLVHPQGTYERKGRDTRNSWTFVTVQVW